MLDDRDALQEFLGDKGIATGLHYPLPLHMQKAYEHLGYKEGDFPITERVAKRLLSLPMYPELTRAQIKYVVDSIKESMVMK
jgi:dTDP-4-amino-4,6-dideoxygalactose transaminase